ncbi:MAG: hypothetical protein A2534_00835 [Candidatus Magasanikbacteria bacterium RIFOXYD2_FULL_39_9]|uniref:Uncharacterized protein n=1 Tax=Candidatus Magasanikbacteria bacterium RIFOXYD1_FULL_40_23 TaxID=1798705 RepID=A0A1F6PB52_9BACT|nr:MAG: hypothetical protein A2534_00835 [Candidatus Magasanikbacteria bacterium RIFOXYD2_FULL_39_9]OGH93389.1 MAG: hypothetical protein A2563_02150 [Candidatus Magasanikbacteria bacterium RIFOXYD1_FULL_40_23]
MLSTGQRHFVDSNRNNPTNLKAFAATLESSELLEELERECLCDIALRDGPPVGEWYKILRVTVLGRMRGPRR